MKRQPALLVLALAWSGLSACAPAQTHSVHLLRPGHNVTGLGGVQVSAPAQWTGPPSVQVTITRLERMA